MKFDSVQFSMIDVWSMAMTMSQLTRLSLSARLSAATTKFQALMSRPQYFYSISTKPYDGHDLTSSPFPPAPCSLFFDRWPTSQLDGRHFSRLRVQRFTQQFPFCTQRTCRILPLTAAVHSCSCPFRIALDTAKTSSLLSRSPS